jgi:hypothetical protein
MPCKCGQQGRLVGTERIDRAERCRSLAVEEQRRALPFEIAEVGAVLDVAEEFGQLTRKFPRNRWRVSEERFS